MRLEITKQDLERAVPAAKEPKGHIFAVLEDAIKTKAEDIGYHILGEPGIAAVEAEGNAADERLRELVKDLACVRAFLDEMRGLDLVLTSTGFGVVSTQDTAPASKQRVDALDGQLRIKERNLLSDLIAYLFRVVGWCNTEQRYKNVKTLFFSFRMLEVDAGISHPKPEDWDVNVPAMTAADTFLRKHISDAYMDELLDKLTSDTRTSVDRPVLSLCQMFIGAWIGQNQQLKEELYRRLINRLELNLELYPTYANSKAYELNHFKPFENDAESGAFHFVG